MIPCASSSPTPMVQFRRDDGLPLVAVTEEWVYLKHACRHVLDANGISNGEASPRNGAARHPRR